MKQRIGWGDLQKFNDLLPLGQKIMFFSDENGLPCDNKGQPMYKEVAAPIDIMEELKAKGDGPWPGYPFRDIPTEQMVQSFKWGHFDNFWFRPITETMDELIKSKETFMAMPFMDNKYKMATHRTSTGAIQDSLNPPQTPELIELYKDLHQLVNPGKPFP